MGGWGWRGGDGGCGLCELEGWILACQRALSLRLQRFSQAQMGLNKGRGWRWTGFPTVKDEVPQSRMGTRTVTARLHSPSPGAFCFSESLKCHSQSDLGNHLLT